MASPPSLPSYSELIDALESTDTPYLPAQIHGFVCGLLCGTSGKMDNSWQNAFIKNKKNRSGRESLQQLCETSYHLISEFSFEFALLLPDDKADINIRTEALGAWCQGFLTGLKQCKIPIENRNPSEMTDALNDIIEIAKVNFGDIPGSEEDETAYFELVEYIRLAVLMIFQELNAPGAENKVGNTWIH